ncbi:transposable element Tcb2 transposase, partial [Trichonephila clavipes]
MLDPYVRPYAAAIGNDFILIDDNARPHRAGIVEEYLEDHGLERMEWPARSPDLNPIEHLWDYLGREVAALNPPPRSLHELKQGLLCVWSSLPIPVSANLINSMGNRCRQCIQPDGRGYELVSSVRALVPQKFSVEEELMHVKHVEVKSPHVGVMWKFGRGLSAQ